MRRLLWLWLALTPCLAHSLELSSTRLLLPADRTDTELWLRNPEAGTWQGEARLYRWQQQDDGEQLLPAEDVALSPRRLQIAAGQRQRLRVVRLGPAPAGV
ncbi:fimbria/pilus periplasmic chaperone [Stenotrophomonas sp. HMWF023]|nr:fimbria/pilus periplasmic chaperone [Stenotrophomonas sp. HMWF023]